MTFIHYLCILIFTYESHTQKILTARAQLYSLISLSYKVHINTIKVHLHQENMRLPSKQLPVHIQRKKH